MTASVEILPHGTDRATWLSVRRTGIGGSDVSTLIGLNRWSSRYELWLDKTGQLPGVDEQSEAAEMGTLLEPVVRDRFARVHQIEVRPVGTLRSTRWPWMICDPDGLCSDGTGYEGKTCSLFQASDWARGQTADHAELQAQWGMAVTGLTGWWVAVLIGGQRNEYRFVDRDEDLIADLVALSGRFWRDHVEAGVEPDVDGTDACTATLKARFPTAVEDATVVVSDVEADELRAAKKQAAADEKAAERAHAAVKNRARALIGDRQFLVTDTDQVVAAWSPIDAVDMARLAAERPELVAEYTVPVKAEQFDAAAFKTDHPDTFAAYRQRRLTFK